MGSKKQKTKIICRVPPRAPGKEAFAGCQVMSHPAKKLKKKIILCRVPSSPGTRQRPMTKKAGPRPNPNLFQQTVRPRACAPPPPPPLPSRSVQLMGLAGFETGRSASEDAAGPPPASPVSRSRSGGAALGSAGKPPLGGGRLRSSLSDGSDAADEDPRCLIRNLDDGREYVVREEFGLREVGTGLRSIRCAAGSLVTHSRDRRSRDEKDTSSEKGGQHSSSATDDSQDSVPRHGPARVKVRQYGKSHKELSGLFMTQQIQAHNGSIWSIKFSPDGRYLASAGEDCIIHVWEVLEFERAGKEREVKENGVCNPLVAMVCNESSGTMVASAAPSGSHWEKKLRSKVLHSGGSVSSDRLMVPEYVFALSEKPVITFAGHSEDVLDLSWSKSQVMYTHF